MACGAHPAKAAVTFFQGSVNVSGREARRGQARIQPAQAFDPFARAGKRDTHQPGTAFFRTPQQCGHGTKGEQIARSMIQSLAGQGARLGFMRGKRFRVIHAIGVLHE